MIFYVFLLFTLVVVTVQGQPVNSLQSVQVAAQLARRIVSDAGTHNIHKYFLSKYLPISFTFVF